MVFNLVEIKENDLYVLYDVKRGGACCCTRMTIKELIKRGHIINGAGQKNKRGLELYEVDLKGKKRERKASCMCDDLTKRSVGIIEKGLEADKFPRTHYGHFGKKSNKDENAKEIKEEIKESFDIEVKEPVKVDGVEESSDIVEETVEVVEEKVETKEEQPVEDIVPIVLEQPKKEEETQLIVYKYRDKNNREHTVYGVKLFGNQVYIPNTDLREYDTETMSLKPETEDIKDVLIKMSESEKVSSNIQAVVTKLTNELATYQLQLEQENIKYSALRHKYERYCEQEQEKEKLQRLLNVVTGAEVLDMSFYTNTLDENLARSIIKKTSRSIIYTYKSDKFATITLSIDKERAYEILETQSALDISFKPDRIAIVAYDLSSFR